MTNSKLFPKKAVSSLHSLSLECVAKSLPIHLQSVQYLPQALKGKLLKKILRRSKLCENLQLNEVLAQLIYPNLNDIDLSTSIVDNSTLNLLKGCSQLTNICLRNCGDQNFCSDGLEHLFQHCTNLQIVDLSRCTQFNDDVLTCLSINCQRLCELCADGCNISDIGLNSLAKYNRTIRCLTISNTNISGDGIRDAVKNKNWKNLEELRVDGCVNVNDDVLKMVVRNSPKIGILTFYNCDITDETAIFDEITKTCKNLKQLHWTINW